MQSEAVSAPPAATAACQPASHRLRRGELSATEMAEGELDVDSLISRLLEGKFVATRRLISSSVGVNGHSAEGSF